MSKDNPSFARTLTKTVTLNTAGAFGAMFGMAGAVLALGYIVDRKDKKNPSPKEN